VFTASYIDIDYLRERCQRALDEYNVEWRFLIAFDVPVGTRVEEVLKKHIPALSSVDVELQGKKHVVAFSTKSPEGVKYGYCFTL